MEAEGERGGTILFYSYGKSLLLCSQSTWLLGWTVNGCLRGPALVNPFNDLGSPFAICEMGQVLGLLCSSLSSFVYQ